MHSLRVITGVVKQQLRRECLSMRALVVAMLSLALLARIMVPVAQMARETGYGVTPAGPIFVFSAIYYTFLSVVMLLGVVLLFSGAPYLEASQTWYILRAGKCKWLIGQMIALIVLSIGYVLLWLVGSVAPFLGNMEWKMEWGTIWSTLAYTNAGSAYGNVLEVSANLIKQYRVADALWLSCALRIGVTLLIALTVFFGNLFFRAPIGTCAGFLLAFEDLYAINGGIGYWFYWLSPATMGRLSMLDPTRTFLMPGPQDALLILYGLDLLLILCIILFGRRRTQL